MEQTAVEWLEMEIQKSIIPAQKDYFKWAFNQAKEMEKEQIIEFAKNCLHEDDCFFVVEQYYNQTFKSE